MPHSFLEEGWGEAALRGDGAPVAAERLLEASRERVDEARDRREWIEHVREGCGPGCPRIHALPVDSKLVQARLIVVQDDGPVLKNRAPDPNLRRPDQLPRSQDDLTLGRRPGRG